MKKAHAIIRVMAWLTVFSLAGPSMASALSMLP